MIKRDNFKAACISAQPFAFGEVYAKIKRILHIFPSLLQIVHCFFFFFVKIRLIK